MRDVRSYLPPVQIGEVMRASGIGFILQAGSGSRHKVGDFVKVTCGWQEYIVVPDKAVEKIIVPKGVEPLDFLNTLGYPGLTAYFGLKDVGQLKSGEVLVVSGAAGAVGSLACQIGKRNGAKVFAIAGTPEKCAWLEKELGVDKALNYKSPTFKKEFRDIGFLDVYFDNVGGEILNMALGRLKKDARVVLCGAISQYNTTKPYGLTNYTSLIGQRGRMQGFIVFDYAEQFPAAIKEISGWLADGSIKRKFHIVEGLEKAPEALPMLFSGANNGKLVIKVSDGPKAAL